MKKLFLLTLFFWLSAVAAEDYSHSLTGVGQLNNPYVANGVTSNNKTSHNKFKRSAKKIKRWHKFKYNALRKKVKKITNKIRRKSNRNRHVTKKKAKPANIDRFEKFNRRMFKINEKADKNIVKKTAKLYRKTIHKEIRRGVRRVFSNIDDVFVVANDILQAKPKQALQDTGRFLINTTAGVFGIFDVAKRFGLEKHDEDFGQTLGRWGVKPGPYLMLPFLGPTNARDLVGDIVHYIGANNVKMKGVYIMGPRKHISSTSTRYAVAGLKVIDTRESMLDLESTVDTFAVDRYATIRDAYMQSREYMVKDGKVPDTIDEPEEATEDEGGGAMDEELDDELAQDKDGGAENVELEQEIEELDDELDKDL